MYERVDILIALLYNTLQLKTSVLITLKINHISLLYETSVLITFKINEL